MKRFRLATWFTLAGLICGGAIAAFVVFVRPLEVDIARPDRDVPVQVFGLGTMEARISSGIGFEVGATLVELGADHGDRVGKGDIVARLDSAQQASRVASAQSALTSARVAIDRAEATVVKARSIFEQSRQTNRRIQALLEQHSVSVEEADEARMRASVAAAELQVAISDVAVAQSILEEARAQYEAETVLLGHYVLRAPYDAIVVQRYKELGSVLAAGEPVFKLVAPETVWALAYVDEARAGDVRVGQPAEIRLRSTPRIELHGHVARVDIESDRVNEERRVYIACGPCIENFHLGEQVEVFITIAKLDEGVLIPATAIDGFDGSQGIVWSVEDGKLHRRMVELGRRTLDSRVEIIDGLPADARVVRKLRSGLREGRAAKPSEGAS